MITPRQSSEKPGSGYTEVLHYDYLRALSAFLWTLSLSAIKERRLPGAERHEPRIGIATPPRRSTGAKPRKPTFHVQQICGAPRPTPRPISLDAQRNGGKKCAKGVPLDPRSA